MAVSSYEPLEAWTLEKVGEWLLERGFSDDIKQSFIDQDMDGEAIVQCFSTCSGPDSLRDIVPTYGKRVKVYTAIKKQLEEEQNCDIPSDQSESFSYLHIPNYKSTADSTSSKSSYVPVSSPTLNPSVSPTATIVIDSPTGEATKSKLKRGCKRILQEIPDPFPLPLFRETTENNLINKRIADDDRKYIVRVLATMLCSYVQRPSMTQCKKVAESLIKKYNFLKESDSWTQFIYVRCQNINRCKKSSSPVYKKAKQERSPAHSYPSLSMEVEDSVSHDRNKMLLKQQVLKNGSRGTIKTLIERTFTNRRQWILDNAFLLEEITSEYPHLTKSGYLTMELDLILGTNDSMFTFTEQWSIWENAILSFSNASKNPPKEIREYLADNSDPQFTALRCLSHFLTSKSKKKQSSQAHTIPFILIEAPRGTPPQEVIDRSNNFPYILRFVDGDCEIDPYYHIVAEQQLVLECRNLLSALYHLISVHYVFNIEYNTRIKDVLFFVQEKVLKIEDNSYRKSPMLLSVTSSIECYLDDH